ncbi:MAG: coproporphyrinogen III oxidase, partial [Pricia sp.]|nr:coproporphyrinogen III oxidase [Pricia sp.]
WLKGNGQRGYLDEDLPQGEKKRKQYEEGKKLLSQAGYMQIGIDHFALSSDRLYTSMKNEALHRNFMGYTASKTQLMVGLGASSISDSWYGFAQNVKNLEEYAHLVEKGIFPIYRGHILNEEDQIVRKHILNLMCRFETSWPDDAMYFEDLPRIIDGLWEMEADGLLKVSYKSLEITPKGRPFVRNICMAFDVLLYRKSPETRLFSMTV